MNPHPRPLLLFKPSTENRTKPITSTAKIKLFISSKIGGRLLVLLLAVSTIPVSGQMAANSTGKFLGNILRSTTTPDADFDTYWNQVTPENSGKWEAVEAARDVMNWTQLDFMYAYTRARGIPFKQHTFVWGQQTPAWVATLTPAEQREEVEEWIAALAARYPATESIDVVNEALHAPAEYRAALGGAGATGWDWVIWSFEKARLHWPNAKLLINDYNILNSDSKTTQYLTIINLLKDRGLIDGIGEQAHFYESTPIATIQNNLARLAATGLPVYISEFDISLANDTDQLNRYQALFPVFWTNPAVRGITLWGYKENLIWRENAYLLRADGSKRPALTWLESYVAANPQILGVAVNSPADGQGFTVGTSVSASATVAYGTTPVTVTFQRKLSSESVFTTVSSDSMAPYTAALGILPLGTYQIRANVTDSLSATATSVTNTFTVSSTPPTVSWDGGTADISTIGDGASNGGDGTWDTTIRNWDQGNGLALVAWNNAANDTAIFGGTAGTITLGTGVTVGGLTFGSAYTLNSNTITFGVAGTISNSAPVVIASALAGTGPLTKAGAGTLTLSGNNSYSGATTISNGVLAISNNTALGATSGATTIVATGANTGPQLSLSGAITSAENITLAGNTEQNQFAGAIVNTSGINSLSGNVTLASPAGAIRTTSVGGELIFAGIITQTGTARALVFQAGSGAAITLNNAIANNNGALNILGFASGSASNGVTLKGGTANNASANVMENGLLKLGITNALKITGSLNLGTGSNFVGNSGFDFGKFDLAGFNQTVSALVGTKNTGGTIGADSNRIVTNSAASGTSFLTVGNGNGTGTFNGVILDGATAAVALTKTGTGTQTLSGNSNYSGMTTITAGTLAITHSNALGSTVGTTAIAATGSTSGGILSLSNNITSAESITITGATEAAGFSSAIINTGGNNILSGNITLSGTNGIRLGATGGTLRISGNISQSVTSHGLAFFASTAITVDHAMALNGGALQVYSSGSVTLKGVNGVGGIGTTSIAQGGTVKLGVSNALNPSASLNIGGPTTQDIGTFDLAGFDQTVNALIGTVGSNAPNSNRKITNSAGGSGTSIFTIGNGNGSGTFNGVIIDGATAKIALVKSGAGTSSLAGVNTYSGHTTVSGGTLALDHPNVNNEASTVTIAASGARLKLNFSNLTPDTVEKLFIGSTQQITGEYGHTDSGANNGGAGVGSMDAYFAAGPGKLNVTTGPSEVSNFAAWQIANTTTQTSDLDHDGDGVPNGVEFFLGGTVNTTGFNALPGVIDTAGTLSVTWTRAGPPALNPYRGIYGTDYVVETSATLSGPWATEKVSPTPGFTVTFPTANEVKYTFPAGIKNFARLKVTGP